MKTENPSGHFFVYAKKLRFSFLSKAAIQASFTLQPEPKIYNYKLVNKKLRKKVRKLRTCNAFCNGGGG